MKKQVKPLLDLERHKPQDCPAGVIGLGLMGSGIASCLLAAGHPVIGLEVDARRRRAVARRVEARLKHMSTLGMLRGDPALLLENLRITSSYADLAATLLVVESIPENLASKVSVLRQLEAVVSPGTLIGTNTSAIPITTLQSSMRYPGRALGMHWSEPCELTVFMEIIRGGLTSPRFFTLAAGIASTWWGKEPSCVRKDIRGFITNRVSYAMYREACHLVETGVATVEDVDRSLRNDVGWWMGLAGPFRYMDLMGVRAYATVMKDLLPDLSQDTKVPRLMRRATAKGNNGSSTGNGFYRYSRAQAKFWEKRFFDYTCDMRALTAKYRTPED